MKLDEKRRVAVVGATGLAGQQFVSALTNHPYFEITALAASPRSAGRSYGDALTTSAGQLSWYADGALDPRLAGLIVQDAEKLDLSEVDVVFTAVDSEPARRLEPIYAKTTPVISTASAFRYEDDVPLLLPGVNYEHASMFEMQRAKRGWGGFIAPNPNCTTVGLAMTLSPLHRAFGVRRVHMVSMQAVSGAGRSPGVIGLDIIDNIVPYIPSEEDKVERETQKILGRVSDGKVVSADFSVSSTCTRVGTIDGHFEAVAVELDKDADEAAITAAWRAHGQDEGVRSCPSAPESLIYVHDDPYRPQVRLDRDLGNGLTTSVGRLRRDHSAKNAWKYVLVAHNTKLGAATGCILVAEHLHHRKLL